MSTAAVYAAEDAAFGGTDHDEHVGLDQIAEVVAGLTSGEWWRSCGVPAVELRAGPGPVRRRRTARSAVSAGVIVRIATPSSSTVSHELAHALAGVGHGHDSTFRAAHVDVVTALAGARVAARLEEAYADHGVAGGSPATGLRLSVLSGPGFVVAVTIWCPPCRRRTPAWTRRSTSTACWC